MAIRFNNDLSAADFSQSCDLRPRFQAIPLAFKALRKAAGAKTGTAVVKVRSPQKCRHTDELAVDWKHPGGASGYAGRY
jgi:hypothetical protein